MLGEGSEKWWSYSAKENGCKGPQQRADTFWRAEEDKRAGYREQTQQLRSEPQLLEARQLVRKKSEELL